MGATSKSMLWRLTSLLLIAALLAIATYRVSRSDDATPAPVETWYAALKAADADAFAKLLAPGATIELRDLSITQTREEFLGSLDEWANANKDADITATLEKLDGQTVTMKVCYKFPSNELLEREVFTLSGEQIVSSVQEQISESCGNE
ncbi:MAG: nuclear transport factor 2 family protein [Nitratireductor sp.]|nr:nuclear transport factor 2 family protein [Nitratireductor sp.]MCC0021922.1 nuclear transport factor 2 family protein [Nitratireductor sp.]